ncbi:Peptidase C2, calpain family like protein [Aduncisulcus paluster]|uniref:Peptidase C2, calpain family like protein n=1 Tax=Aduncisulcus paluster TaxID=2918883 RepID=A0ABQ5K4Z4_9EUKA|nr:Peptidase C2, calpain family like protein [Aduncisulcus paluster]|eukprot:gnl/Carplike_NY0171/1275_a1723_1000.p1 GENE.gnl/Carplike_NY0171/1275_a1723_1000~~gnl/Carplike_NY0171/1275_a1723_1000.p1  ORF type:complete len:575 (+),score=161.00 gnl/Carplike_NY0171/1275_a1723_1000:25-1749(+)
MSNVYMQPPRYDDANQLDTTPHEGSQKEEEDELPTIPTKKSILCWLIPTLIVVVLLIAGGLFFLIRYLKYRVPEYSESGSVWSVFGMVPIEGAELTFNSLPQVTDEARVSSKNYYMSRLSSSSDVMVVAEDGGFKEDKVSSANPVIANSTDEENVGSQFTDDGFVISETANSVVKRPDDGTSLVVGSFAGTDIAQGSVGDCWYLSALSSLAYANIISSIPPRWSKDNGSIVGSFFFGDELVELVSDDTLSYYAGNTSNPTAAKSTDDGEMWVSFVEKLMAKLAGSYANIDSDSLTNGFTLMHPGFPVYNSLSKDVDHKWIITEGIKHKGIATASIPSGDSYVQGLPTSHAYSLLSVTDVPSDIVTGGVTLYKLRNPWGSTEFTGDYNDSDTVWDTNTALSEYMDFEEKNDGIFFMQQSDFYSIYSTYAIVYSPSEYKHSKIIEIPLIPGKKVIVRINIPAPEEDAQVYILVDRPSSLVGYPTPTIAYYSVSYLCLTSNVGIGLCPPAGTASNGGGLVITSNADELATARVAIFSDVEWEFNKVTVDGVEVDMATTEVEKPSYIDEQTKYIMKHM